MSMEVLLHMRTTLREGEKVILQVEKHRVVLIKSWLIFAGSVVLLMGTIISTSQLAKNFLSYVFVAVVFAGIHLWYAIAERRVDIWIVTNLRVIDESGIITHQAKESPLDKINNIQYRQTVAGRMLDFGDVEIQTAAEQGATINKFVSHPKLLHDTVVVMQGKMKDADHNTTDRCRYESESYHDDDMECPFCAEVVKKKAKVCKHCGKDLVSQNAQSSLTIISSPETGVSISAQSESTLQDDSSGVNPRNWMSK
jgi:uncharacterized membrane protein YdbT with pleckstrin-like domain